MANILVVDVQKGYINDDNKYIIPKINEYLKSKKFENSLYTKFITHHKDNLYKSIFWDGIYDKELQKLAVKKLMYSKEFKKKCHGLTRFALKYIQEKNIKDIEICGIDNDGSISYINKMLQSRGINSKIIDSLVCPSRVYQDRLDINYPPNLVETINGFYVGEIIGNAYKNRLDDEAYPYGIDRATYSDCTVLTCATLEWLLSSKKEPATMFNILSYYNRFYPFKNYSGIRQFANWVQNGCRTYRMCEDNIAIRMCAPIGWYSRSFDEVDELIKSAILPANNSEDAYYGARLYTYAVRMLTKCLHKKMLTKKLSDFFDVDWSISIEQRLANFKECASTTNTALLAITIFNNISSYKEAIQTTLALNHEPELLTSLVSALAEAYYFNLPYEDFIVCKTRIPDKFKKVIFTFGKRKSSNTIICKPQNISH